MAWQLQLGAGAGNKPGSQYHTSDDRIRREDGPTDPVRVFSDKQSRFRPIVAARNMALHSATPNPTISLVISDLVGGRFRIVRELGRGGMGVVYEVLEERTHRRLALKALVARDFSESALRHFEEEFRTLTSLSHPNLTEVYDFGRVVPPGSARQVPYFTMELVEGKPIDQFVQERGLDFQLLYALLAQVTQALAYLHLRGLVHQDVKPSNILVIAGDHGDPARVKLMDLGLAGRPKQEGRPGTIRGTAAYLSPEAARGGPVDQRSDLYGLGCVAYQIVTGRPPFVGTSPLGILRSHLLEEPLAPSVFNRGIPHEFEAVLLKLLAKDPGLRFASADRFLEALNRAAGGGLEVRTGEVLRRRVLGGGFVGRNREMEGLEAYVEQARRGQGQVVFLVGDAGIGKSRLLREFQVRCQLEGVEFHVGHCADGAAFSEAISSAVRSRGGLPDDLRSRHGASLEALLGLSFAAQTPLTESPPIPQRDAPAGPLPAAAAVVEEIARAGPFVIALEDLQWADETTCALLLQSVHLLAARGAGGNSLPLLLIGTYRADEVSRSSPLFDLLGIAREEGVLAEVFLGPLSRDESGALLRSLLGAENVPSPFLDRLHEETRGNPFVLTELVALLAEEGLLEPGTGIAPTPEILDRVELPGRVRDLLTRRLARVEAEPLEVLKAVAVLGGSTIDVDAVTAVTGKRWDHVVRQLRDLADAGLVVREVTESGEPAYQIASQHLAALVLDLMPAEEARTLNERAFVYFERRGVPDRHGPWAQLARHAERGGLGGRAVEANARAGELAERVGAHQEAVELYGRAIDLLLRLGHGPSAALCDLYSKRGAVFARTGDLQHGEEDFRWMLAGAEKEGNAGLKARANLALGRLFVLRAQLAEGQENLEIAQDIAESTGDRGVAAEAAIGLGQIATRLAHFEDALAHFERGQRIAGEVGRFDAEIEALLGKGAVLREQGNYHLSLSCFEEAAARTSGRSAGSLEIAVDEGAAGALEVQGNHREAAAAYARARAKAQQRGDVMAAARLTTSLAAVHRKIGEFDTARREIDAALADHRRVGARDGMVQSYHELATLHMDQGNYQAAIEAAEDALRMAQKLGRRDLLAASLNLTGGVHARAGDLEVGRSLLEEALRIAREARGPRRLATLLADLGDLNLLSARAAEARGHYQESAFLARRIGDRRLEAAVLVRLGEAHLLENDFDRSQVSCRKALSLVDGMGLPREEAEAILLRSRIALTRPGGDVVRAEIDAVEAMRRFTDLKEPERAWQAEHLACKAAMRLGRREEAAARIERCYRYLEGVRQRLSGRWRETFLNDFRRRDVYEDRERLSSSIQRDTVAPSEEAPGGEYVRLREEVRVLRRLLDAGRRFAEGGKGDEIPVALLDTAITLTGAERGLVRLRDGREWTRGPIGHGKSEASLGLARDIAARILANAEPLLATHAETDTHLGPTEVVIDLGIRTILSVPIRQREEVVGVLYLDSRREGAAFSALQLEIASRLAEQAGAGLETARLIARTTEQKVELERLNQELEKTVQAQRNEIQTVREELVSTRSSLELRYRFEDLVGASPAMLRVYHVIERLAPKRLPVLVVGESGTGKELIARALHAKGDRSAGPFFSVNCAALTETLLESELFGYRRGAFTGADRDKPGYFELAHGGTLFLDEIGDMGLAVQAKLLRALQSGEVLPVGGKAAIRVDVRIVSATNRDLLSMIRDAKFREDLYYRINVARIEVPPLRERREDIPLLVDHFLGILSEEERQPKKQVAPDALRRLVSLDWHGNVRELQHLMLRAATFAKGSVITLRDLERYADLPKPHGALVALSPAGPTPGNELASLDELERRQILLALEAAKGNRTKAAEILGINRATLFRKLKRFGLPD
jgi:two-component system response regulator AtoC